MQNLSVPLSGTLSPSMSVWEPHLCGRYKEELLRDVVEEWLTAGELADIVGHSDEKSSCLHMLSSLHMQLRERERVSE